MCITTNTETGILNFSLILHRRAPNEHHIIASSHAACLQSIRVRLAPGLRRPGRFNCRFLPARACADECAAAAQLALVDLARRVREQVLSALGLRKGNHIAYRLGACHERYDAIQSEGQATCGGAPY